MFVCGIAGATTPAINSFIMERTIRTLYIFSIIAIVAFLGMQAYWLYNRYEYSLTEYEDICSDRISNAIAEYNKIRSRSPLIKEAYRIQSSYNMNTDIDSTGDRKRTVTVTTRAINGRKLLGIAENRNLTPEELKRLEKLVIDSIDMAEAKIAKIAEVDATTAPSDGVAWNAMRNYESELQYPFTKEGIDSILKKNNLNAESSLILQDSLTWNSISVRHSSLFYPRFKVITPIRNLKRRP